ncbi:MAG TPA: sigma 54-interacting transcriptional regulator [Gemmatimonadales bacterium]|nr:sigma 54-interacting transcriptional regulator [Gemmatimonadales bacterium]
MATAAEVRDRLVELLRSTSGLLSVSRDLDEVLEAIVRGLTERIEGSACSVWLYRPDAECAECARNGGAGAGSALHLETVAGIGGDIVVHTHRIPLGRYLVGRAAERRTSIRLNDFTERWRAYRSGRLEPPFDYPGDEDDIVVQQIIAWGGVGAALYPLQVRDELVGILALWAHRPLTEDETAVFEMFAVQAAIAIKGAEMFATLKRANLVLEAENAELRGATPGGASDGLIGESSALLDVIRQARQVAPTDTTVLILGETGTGKERLARLLHEHSLRRDQPMIKVNSGAIAPGVAESELFGHERGAFTGASQRRIGRFELAHRGTLFMDEVGELPPDLQVKLLRALQEREIERVGGAQSIPVDVRVIAATNRNLEEDVRAGRFRTDLYYRLNVVPLRMPALRERREDIPALAMHFLGQYARRLGKPLQGFTPATMRRLESYDWPGNVRELQNVVERLCVLATEPMVSGEPTATLPSVSTRQNDSSTGSLQVVEKRHIEATLETVAWRIEGSEGAAARLGLAPSTLRARMRKLGIKRGS